MFDGDFMERYRERAKNDDPIALLFLANLFYYGNKCEKNLIEAKYCLERSIELGTKNWI